MPVFRGRPVLISALQWTENVSMSELSDFANGLVQLNDVDRVFRVYDRVRDRWAAFEYGDWIIRGTQGEFYPCRSDVFEAMYEPAELAPGEPDVDAEAVR